MNAAFPALLLTALLGCAEPAFLPEPDRTGHFVAPDGSDSADGSAARPWSLAAALAGGRGRVRPGDTIWVHGGTYEGRFTTAVRGAPGRPVVVRAYPGERAIIDGATGAGDTFVVARDWTVLWGLEFTNSKPDRSRPRPDVVVNQASHTRYVNLVIHDGGIAFFTYAEFVDVEVYGAIIFNSGWDEQTRANGHALYLKSEVGPLVVRDNVMFNQFGYGVHAYTDRGSGAIRGLLLDGNIAFNNGTLAPTHPGANLLVGGQEPADNVTVTNNVTWYPAGLREPNVEIGFQTYGNGFISLRGNLLLGGDPVLDVGSWQRATIEGNGFAGTDRVVALRDPTPQGYVWRTNRYYRDPSSNAWRFAGSNLPFAAWQAATQLGATDSAADEAPREPHVLVRANRYEPGRATITVINWLRQPVASVDLSGVLAPGDSFVVHNVQDLFGAPVAGGTFSGAAAVPLAGVAPPVPVGLPASPAPATGPDFDVFLVRRVRGAGTP